MIEYAGLIAYLWFISENLAALFNILLFVIPVILLLWVFILIVITDGFEWLTIKNEGDVPESYYSQRIKEGMKHQQHIIRWVKIFLVLLLIQIFTPTRNQLVIIFSAKPIVETGITMVNTISDSNTTKSIGNILNNSLKYLEAKSNKLDE